MSNAKDKKAKTSSAPGKFALPRTSEGKEKARGGDVPDAVQGLQHSFTECMDQLKVSMARQILSDHNGDEKENEKPGKKEKKAKESKSKKKSKTKKKVSESDEKSSQSESGESQDPEKIMSSLALQLNLSQAQLKIKGTRVLKVEDLTPEALQFIIAHPSGCHLDLPELSTFTLHECGGELYQMRKAAVARLQGKLGKRKGMESKDLRTHTQAEEVCLQGWKKRLLDIYELVTGKSRMTHLLGFNTLMQLRESTLPCIRNTLAKEPTLPKLLKKMVQKYVDRAKKDVEDYYDEVTFRKERLLGAGGHGRKRASPEKSRKCPNKTKEAGGEKKKPKKAPEKSASEESEPEEVVVTPNSEDEEEEEEVPAEEEAGQSDDADLWGDRYTSPSSRTPSSIAAGSKRSEKNPDHFQKTVVHMLGEAVKCGIFNKDRADMVCQILSNPMTPRELAFDDRKGEMPEASAGERPKEDNEVKTDQKEEDELSNGKKTEQPSNETGD